MAKCRECENREIIFDEELWDIVGRKCSLTESIISAEVEDNIKECEEDCPQNSQSCRGIYRDSGNVLSNNDEG